MIVKEAANTRRAMSVNEAADALGLGRSTVYGLLKSGQLEAIRLGRRTIVTSSSIDRLLARAGAL